MHALAHVWSLDTYSNLNSKSNKYIATYTTCQSALGVVPSILNLARHAVSSCLYFNLLAWLCYSAFERFIFISSVDHLIHRLKTIRHSRKDHSDRSTAPRGSAQNQRLSELSSSDSRWYTEYNGG